MEHKEKLAKEEAFVNAMKDVEEEEEGEVEEQTGEGDESKEMKTDEEKVNIRKRK